MQFKKGTGWKACYDEDRNVYTAERYLGDFYQLCEIDKDTYDKLETDAMGDETSGSLIGKGRQLVFQDGDSHTMAYSTICDENYYELAPWADAHRRVMILKKFPYGTLVDSYILRAIDKMKSIYPWVTREILKYTYAIEFINGNNEYVRYFNDPDGSKERKVVDLNGEEFIDSIIADNKDWIENANPRKE